MFLLRENLSKLLCLLLFCAALFAFSKPAHAEGHSAGLMIGQAWPSGDFGKNVDGNVAPGVFYEYAASDIFSLYATGTRSSHSDETLKITSTDLGIKSNLVYYDKLSPFAFLAMGLYFVDKRLTTREEAKGTLFGFNAGAGADLDLSDKFYLGMLFTLHNLFAKKVTLPIAGTTELSGRWAGFFLRGGFRF